MFNLKLRRNIKMLDVQIGELSAEIQGLIKDTKYESKMKSLDELVELRSKLAKSIKEGETSNSLIELDKQIEEHVMVISKLQDDSIYSEKMKKLEELTKTRCQLTDAKTKESILPVILPSLVTGAIGIISMAMVLKYEESDVITSKAFGMVSSIFRGR